MPFEPMVTPPALVTGDFENKHGHDGCVVWLTGLSGSGKSTIANRVARTLFAQGKQVYVLDGDTLRQGLNRDLGFSPKDREENIRRAGEVAKLFRLTGFIVIAAFISPYKKDRDVVRSIVDAGHFFEVHVHADVQECIRRDPKGLYEKALAGKIPEFTGVSAPYEAPESPELLINTVALDEAQSAEALLSLLRERNVPGVSRVEMGKPLASASVR